MADRTGVAGGTANDRFKGRYGAGFWRSVVLATVLHAVLLGASPTFGVESRRASHSELATLDLPAVIEIPPPPEALRRPPTPVIPDVAVSDDLTIPPTTFTEYTFASLAPPPPDDRDISAAPTFTPMTVRPALRNEAAVQAALLLHYPPLLRQAGIGGVVGVWFLIGVDGRVLKTQIARSSGHESLDRAALRVAAIMEFSPAYDRDRAVPAWVTFEIQFEAP